MKKEFNMMLIMLVSTLIGIIFAIIMGQLYTEGYISSLLVNGMTISDLQFLIFFVWLIGGMIAGVMKN